MLSADNLAVFRGGDWIIDVGNNGFQGEDSLQFGLGGDTALSGDLNGDGRDEIFVYRNGNWIVDWENNGYTGEGVFVQFGGFAQDLPLVGDLNGDGRDEIIIYRSGNWIVDWENNGYTGEGVFVQFGGFAQDKPLVGDLNGDGRDEIIIYRDGNLFVDWENNGYTGEVPFVQFGGFTQDKPLVGDLDGDGRDEITIFRNGSWIVDRENNGYSGETSMLTFGSTMDQPILAKFGAATIARVAKSLTGNPADVQNNAKNNFGVTQLKIDGTNLLVGNGFHIIGGKKANQDTQDNHINSEDPKNGNGVMYVGSNPLNGMMPFNLTFSGAAGDKSKLNFAASVGPSDTEFSSISIPLEARMELFSHYRSSTSTTMSRFDQIPVDPNYGGGQGQYSIAQASGNPVWGELIGDKYTIRVTINNPSRPMQLFFVNAPGLATGVRDVEFSFGAVKPRTTLNVSGSIQVFRTDPQLFAQAPPKPIPPKPTPTGSVFEAETDLAHQIGRRDIDGWSVNVLDTRNRYLSYGPYTRAVPAGKRTASFRLMLDNVTADNRRILTIDVYDADSGKVLAKRELRRRDFAKTFTYQDFNLSFSAIAGHRLEFRTFWHGYSYVRQDKVSIF